MNYYIMGLNCCTQPHLNVDSVLRPQMSTVLSADADRSNIVTFFDTFKDQVLRKM